MFEIRIENLTWDAIAKRMVNASHFALLDDHNGTGWGADYILAFGVETRFDSLDALHKYRLDIRQHNSIFPTYLISVDYETQKAVLPSHFDMTNSDSKRSSSGQVILCEYRAAIKQTAIGEISIVGFDEEACRRLESLIQKNIDVGGLSFHVGEIESTSRNLHHQHIEAALFEIQKGNVYQVNLARRWTATFSGSSFGLALAMRTQSPVPFGIYWRQKSRDIIGRSMESYLEWDGKHLRSSPIKGTALPNVEQEHLRKDPKEHAEHSMIVDLIRNDLGKVAEDGSVEVESFLRVERFAKVSHLISTIRIRPKSRSWHEILDATFPPGSVTGAPKITAMHLIAELEPFERGLYCGTYGAIFSDGSAKFSVAIRSAEIRDGEVIYSAGGGIVAASQIEKELDESELKAKVFLDALKEPMGQ